MSSARTRSWLPPTTNVPSSSAPRSKAPLCSEVAQGELTNYLEAVGGVVDPIADVFTGWVIKRVGRSPAFDAKLFTGMNTLQEYAGPPDDEEEATT